MQHADRVKGQYDLFVVFSFSAQTDIELVKILLRDLRSFFDPNSRNVVDGFQLFHIIQPRENDLRSVPKQDIHIGAFPLRDLQNVPRVVGFRLCFKLIKTAFTQCLTDLSHNEKSVSRLRCASFQHLTPGEYRLPGACASF